MNIENELHYHKIMWERNGDPIPSQLSRRQNFVHNKLLLLKQINENLKKEYLYIFKFKLSQQEGPLRK